MQCHSCLFKSVSLNGSSHFTPPKKVLTGFRGFDLSNRLKHSCPNAQGGLFLGLGVDQPQSNLEGG